MLGDFFETIIQLYSLNVFLYSLTFCIKQFIKSRIALRFNETMPAYEAAMAWNMGIPCNFFQNTNSIVFALVILLFFTNCIKESLKGNTFDIIFKSVGLWCGYGLKQGNPFYLFQNINPIILVIFISLFFDLLYQRCYRR